MKRIFLSCALAVSSCMSFAAGQMDGGKYHKLTMEYETPHLEWAGKLGGGPVKALFVVNLDNARLVVETAQRMQLDFDVVTTALRFPRLGITEDDDGYSGKIYGGTSYSSKCEELIGKLDARYDVIVVVFNDLNQMPARAKLKMLSQVKQGSGLVFCQAKGLEPLKNIFSEPDKAGAEAIFSLAQFPPAKKGGFELKTYKYGQGRIASTSSMIKVPYYYTSPRWWAEFENGETLFIRTLLWAAGREPGITVKVPEIAGSKPLQQSAGKLSVEIDSKNSGRLDFRLRDEFNWILKTYQVVFKGAEKSAIDLPPLGTGTYYLDVIASDDDGVDNIGFLSFDVDSGVRAELLAEDDAVKDFDPIRATLKLSKAVAGARAVVSLADSPYARVWFRKEIELGERQEIPIEVRDYYMPTLAAFLQVEVKQGGTPLAFADKTFFLPIYNQKPPTYCDFYWEYNPGASDRLRSMAEGDLMGYTGNFCRIDGDRPGVQSHMLLNKLLGANITAIGLEKSKTADEFTYPAGPLKNMSDEDNAVLAAMGGRYSPGNPNADEADRILTRSCIRNKRLDKYPLAFYQMGNEVSVSYDGGFGAEDAKAFAEMLKERYGAVEKLNAEWGREYKSFEDVPNMHLEEARTKGLYPEYMAHRRYVDGIVTRRFAVVCAETRKADPFARIGCDGVWSLSNSGFNMEDVLNNPEIGYWEHYSRLPRAEIMRSIRPEMFRGFIWGWIMSNESMPEAPWFNLLTGCGKHADWFISGCGGSQQLAPDYRPWRPQMVVELEKLRTGIAQLLNTVPLRFDGAAIWESYNSNVAGLLGDPCMPSSNDTVMPLISLCYQNGINFDFITRHTISDRLKKYRLMFLPCSVSVSIEEEKAMREFVEDGGIIVADINPGIMNDSFRFLPENRLSDLFGKFDGKIKPESAPLKISAELNGKLLAYECAAANTVLGLAPFAVRKIGKGQAVLLNFTFASARDSGNSAAFDKFMLDMMSACGVSPSVRLEGLPPESIVRVRQGEGFELVGVTNRRMASAGENGKENVLLKFPENGYIYEVWQGEDDPARMVDFNSTFDEMRKAVDSLCEMKGRVVKGGSVSFKLSPPFRLYSFFKDEQQAPPMKLSGGTAVPGRPLELDLSPFPPGRVLCLQIRDKDGRLVNPRCEAVTREVFEVAPGRPKHLIYFPFNAPKGEYGLTLRDVATGLSSMAKVKLEE